MALSFDLPPIYEKMVTETGHATPNWHNWFSQFSQTVQQYLSAYGVQMPLLTTTQAGTIIAPPNGTHFTNVTTGVPQFFLNGVIKSISYT